MNPLGFFYLYFFSLAGGSHVHLRLPGQRRRRHPRRLPHSAAEQDGGHEDQGDDPGVPHRRRGDSARPHRALPQPGGQGRQRGLKGQRTLFGDPTVRPHRKRFTSSFFIGGQEFLLGEWSCLHVVLELIDSKQQGKYWCPPLLHRSALCFLLALWQDRRDSAISVLRKK